MTACPRHIWGDDTGLTCVETRPHDTHRYTSSGGDLAGQEHKDGGGEDG